jgi:hypothetical protein
MGNPLVQRFAHVIPTFPKTFPARPGLRGGTAAAAALGAGRLGLRSAAGSGRGGPRRTAGGGEPWPSASLQIQKKGFRVDIAVIPLMYLSHFISI